MKRVLVVFAISFFIICSCQHGNVLGDNELPVLAKAQYLTSIDSINLESRGILNPVIMRFCDDFLIFHATAGQKEMHFLNLRDMSVVEKKVAGPGPNEVNGNYTVISGNDESSINYIDNGTWNVYSFNLDSMRVNPATQQQWLYKIPNQKGVALLQVPLETERFVYFTGVYSSGEGWIYCYDKQTQKFRSYGDFPDYEELAGYEYMTKSMIFSIMMKATDGKRLALASWGTFDLYDITEDGGLEVYREHHYFMPDISVYPNGTFAYKGKNAKLGFSFSITSDDRFVYLLYSDKVIDENPEGVCEYLFVYDWDGNPVRQYNLEKPLSELAINGTTLYGLSREVEPIVYIYDLKDLHKK